MRRAGILAILALAAPARAQPAKGEPLDLEWIAPAACPRADHVTSEVARILGGASGPQKHVTARVVVEATEKATWRVTLSTQSDGAVGRRTFEAESCNAAADATALLLAITANPSAARTLGASPGPPPPSTSTSTWAPSPNPNPAPAQTPEQTQPPTPTPTPRPTPASTPTATPLEAPTAATPPPAPPRPTPLSAFTRSFAIGASLAADTSTLPSAAIGAEGSLSWLPSPARLELTGTYWAPQSASALRAGADFQLLTIGIRGAYAWSFGPFAAGPLASIELARLTAAGFGGTATSFRQSAVWGEAGGGALFMWSPLAKVAVRLALQGAVPLARPSFVVIQPAPLPATGVHRPGAVTGRALLGAELQFF